MAEALDTNLLQADPTVASSPQVRPPTAGPEVVFPRAHPVGTASVPRFGKRVEQVAAAAQEMAAPGLALAK